MTADAWTKAVRRQLGLGRVLALGGPRDGAWITERAAEAVLRRAAADVRGARLGPLRISLAAPEHAYDAYAPAVPPPPSALPPGPLRITADFLASAHATAEPFPTTATHLRAALAGAATRQLGLTVTEVDLRVSGLLDTDEDVVHPPEDHEDHSPTEPPSPGDDEESRVAAAALSVPGVTRLTGTLGGLGRAVLIETGPALPRRHVRVEVTVGGEERALDVARAVRRKVGKALPGHPTVAVLVTAVEGAATKDVP
ncbi:nucleopolyhedrovirus P10 family protein [Streptomyces ipomoeae]|uniref:nucleopolyhedrovirus P10 family protein n=1 Tax=Streptomyces ipomoeae TaxID=103232 RepID=UPI001146FE40|nr:nucleopolyhedrovirus P10 family protein [Streptomyces ipomoeae]MDX2935142.1 nucleopolyhedrovirus P10 family protein [Streptomyces ipomoeae]TQE19136.1 nucleopolyhedrovirus P10 family protein [Streptomyces ipomoeae]